MITCRGCRIDFIPKRKGQEYHDITCYRQSTTKLFKCPECGTEFKRKSTSQVCCSRDCGFSYRAKRKTKGIYVPCTYDGKPVYKMQSRVKKYNFCNRICRVAYLRSPLNTSMSKGWHQKEDAKKKISKAGLGRKPTAENIEKLKEANRNRIWTAEMRDKARQSHLGKTTPEEVKQKIKAHAKYGWKNKSWRGRYAGYNAKHAWAKKHMQEPKICVEAAIESHLCSQRIEVSNKNHQNRKKKRDWEWRCTYHHRKYDWQVGQFNPKGKAMRFVANFGNIHMRSITMDGIIVDKRESIQLI